MSLVRISDWYKTLRQSLWGTTLYVLIGILFSSNALAQDSLQRYEYRQTRMGMAVRVVLYAPHDTTARQAGRTAFRLMEDLETVLSSYRSSSELNRLSDRAGEGPVSVSRPLFTVLQTAQQLARHSEGAFDVTAGPYLDLWSRAREHEELPDSAALRRASARVGWTNVHLNEEHRTVRLAADSMQLNVGGIAKGYILDRALDTLAAEGVSRAMIEAGGDIVVSGSPPDRAGWEIRLPGADSHGQAQTLRLDHAAVSTSGDTHQFVEIDGTRYSHVVDPRTGLGLTHRLLVTIIAEDGTTADGLATTVGVLGADAGRAFLDEHYPSVRAYIRPASPSSD